MIERRKKWECADKVFCNKKVCESDINEKRFISPIYLQVTIKEQKQLQIHKMLSKLRPRSGWETMLKGESSTGFLLLRESNFEDLWLRSMFISGSRSFDYAKNRGPETQPGFLFTENEVVKIARLTLRMCIILGPNRSYITVTNSVLCS
jgi:hypothetical protein